MPQNVVFVHGYSVRSLGAYGQFPSLLVSEGLEVADIQLSAFDSLDNTVTCDDLASALEDRISTIEPTLDISQTAFVTHSTGAMITRRWMLNRVARNRELPADQQSKLPSHFVSLAGANHGSTLAQVGQTALNRLRQEFAGANGIGQQVLTDLDYGSSFLRKLNREWLESLNSGELDGVFVFSLIGDDHQDFMNQIIWQSHEYGSDGTVRIAGSNLNYTWLEADLQGGTPKLKQAAPQPAIAHLIVPGYSHTGRKGIIDSVTSTQDVAFRALMEAFNVQTAPQYATVLAAWESRTQAWIDANAPTDLQDEHGSQVASLIVFRLTDENGKPIPDHLIILGDQNGDPRALTGALEPHQPIQNEIDGSAVSFYVRSVKFSQAAPHTIHIEAHSGSPLVAFNAIDYTLAANLNAFVRPNETTYVDVVLDRDASAAYRLISLSTNPDTTRTWPPLP